MNGGHYSQVVCPENKGDRFEFSVPAAGPRRTDKKSKDMPAQGLVQSR